MYVTSTTITEENWLKMASLQSPCCGSLSCFVSALYLSSSVSIQMMSTVSTQVLAQPHLQDSIQLLHRLLAFLLSFFSIWMGCCSSIDHCHCPDFYLVRNLYPFVSQPLIASKLFLKELWKRFNWSFMLALDNLFDTPCTLNHHRHLTRYLQDFQSQLIRCDVFTNGFWQPPTMTGSSLKAWLYSINVLCY